MPREEIRPEDEPAVVARCVAVLDAGGGVSTVRRLCIECHAVALNDVTLTELARLLERSAGINASRNGRVVKV